MESSSERNEILSITLEILRKIPLCPSCLGRCFANTAYGLTNRERGNAIFTVLTMELDLDLKSGRVGDLKEVTPLLSRLGDVGRKLLNQYGVKSDSIEECYICHDQVDRIKEDFYRKAEEVLQAMHKPPFVLGVKLSKELAQREREVSSALNLRGYESIKAEIKREVGKRLASAGYTPSIENPEVEIFYDMDEASVKVVNVFHTIMGAYIRYTRSIPIDSWGDRESFRSLSLSDFYVPFSEDTNVRVMCGLPVIFRRTPQREVSGYKYFLGKRLNKHTRASVMGETEVKREYRVLLSCNEAPENSTRIEGPVYEVIAVAKGVKEISELFPQCDIISVDLIGMSGKIARYMGLLV